MSPATQVTLVPGALTMLVALRKSFYRILNIIRPRKHCPRSTGSFRNFQNHLRLTLSTVVVSYSDGMGATQSRPRTLSPGPHVSPEERAQTQAEAIVFRARHVAVHRADNGQMRAKQQTALDKRFATQLRKPSPSRTGQVPQSTSRPKKMSTLEQMSQENVGWRNADANHDLRSWN